jgi:hypothetical protein
MPILLFLIDISGTDGMKNPERCENTKRYCVPMMKFQRDKK